MRRAFEDSAASDATLRCFAPRCLREPYLRAQAAAGGPSELLGRRLYFAEVAARYLTAVLAADPVVVDAPPPGLVRLLGRIDRPTLGLWLEAADGMARLVAARGGPLAPLAAGLRDGDGRPGPAHAAFAALVEARNRIAHGDGGLVPSREDAALWLEHVTPALRALATAMRAVARHPVGCVDALDFDAAGRPVAHVLWFAGAETTRVSHPLERLDLWPRAPFVVGGDGRLLPLPPLAVAAVFERRGETELRLLARVVDGQPFYSDPTADAPAPPLDPAPAIFDARWGAPAEWAARVPPPSAAALPGAAAADRLPERVGHYEVFGRIGAGGGGVVYAARSDEGHLVALKVLARTAQPSAAARQRFAREAEILRRLEHPGVVRLVDSGFDPEAGPWLAQEYVDGADLVALYRDRRAEPAEALGIARHLLVCLADVHTRGVLHRDVKPSNVLVDARGRVRLVDFGIARDLASTPLTGTLDALGTLAYAAPEQLAGERVDTRADLYGVGRVLAWLLTGDPAGRPATLPGLAAFVRRLAAHAPDDRYPSAAEALGALDALGDLVDAPPVQPGTRLAGGYRVERVVERVRAGAWRLAAREPSTALEVTLVVAPAGTASAASLVAGARLAASDADLRVASGYRALLDDDDLVVLVADPQADLGFVLGAGEARRVPRAELHDTAEMAAVRPAPAAEAPASEAPARPSTPAEVVRALPGVDRVDVETDLLGNRTLIARAADGRALVVAQSVERLPAGDPRYDPTLLRLVSRAVALHAPLLGLTDGRAWVWVRRLGHRSLSVVVDPADALRRAGAG